MATPGVFLYAAIRLRSVAHWLVLAVYTVLFVTAWAAVDTPEGSAGDAVFALAFLGLAVGGTGHAFAIRRRVFGTGRAAAPDGFGQALDVAKNRREMRRRARALVADDPSMAREIRIGRPDLPRTFDDGGLVDINHAPPAVLARLPGLTPRLVDQIVRAREDAGTFVSAEELSVLADLPARLTPEIAEYAIFLP